MAGLRAVPCSRCAGSGVVYIPTPKIVWKRERVWIQELETNPATGKKEVVGHLGDDQCPLSGDGHDRAEVLVLWRSVMRRQSFAG